MEANVVAMDDGPLLLILFDLSSIPGTQRGWIAAHPYPTGELLRKACQFSSFVLTDRLMSSSKRFFFRVEFARERCERPSPSSGLA